MNQEICDDVYYLINQIKDPEFPYTLEQLKVVSKELIEIKDCKSFKEINIYWVPTVKHCNFAFQIALSIRVKLLKELQNYNFYKIQILVKQGTHIQEREINKQVNDKERFLAAMENEHLMEFIQALLV